MLTWIDTLGTDVKTIESWQELRDKIDTGVNFTKIQGPRGPYWPLLDVECRAHQSAIICYQLFYFGSVKNYRPGIETGSDSCLDA
jgi:hypothetical protein